MSEETIFAVALELKDPQQRAAYLNQACGSDAMLRKQVEALLTAHEGHENFLQNPAADEFTMTSGDFGSQRSGNGMGAILEAPGTLVGPYKLLERIGEGGFGVVYRAEQKQPVQRQVALKIIKPGMDTEEVIARFESERQALAMMDHQHIARVLDGGATASGRPYFVMELVKGLPITEYCDRHHVSTPERLQLFIAICEAVQHAHQKGIIHRDLKPSNVLVTMHDGHPMVKVIDFGVAKATSQRLTARTLFTRQGQLVGTLQYMSPEQAAMSSIDVDTRSDVYSLGVLLFELLTGTTPIDQHRLRNSALTEVQRIIREEEPPKPSTRVSDSADQLPSIAALRRTEPKKLCRLLRGELDWIVLKALEKDRTRRYETANGLAMDVRRFLADEPVLAGPPSTSYKLRKFARKNFRWLATVAAFVMLLVTATIVTSWLAVHANRQRAEAIESRNLARVLEKTARSERNSALAAKAGAQRERNSAIYARNMALQAGHRAAMEQRRAEYQRDVAREAKKEEARQREVAESNLYFSRISLAYRAWQANDVTHTIQLLNLCLPRPGETDRRHWEWHYLKALCQTELVSLDDHDGSVLRVAHSRDGRLLASAGGGQLFYDNPGHSPAAGQVIVRHADTGQPLHVLRGHEHLVTAIAFSPDGERIATGSHDETIRIWSTDTGEQLQVIRGHLGPIVDVAFVADGSCVVSAGSPSLVRRENMKLNCWDAHSGELQWSLPTVGAPIAVHPDQQLLAVSGARHELQIVDLNTQSLLQTLKGAAANPQCITFSPDGTTLAAGDSEAIYFWSVASGELLRTADEHEGTVRAIEYHPTGKLLATAGDDTTIRIWNPTTMLRQSIIRGPLRTVCSISFHPRHRRLASASHDGTVAIWDLTHDQRGLMLGPIAHPTHAKGDLAFRADGKELVVALPFRETFAGMKALRADTGALVQQHVLPVTGQRRWPRNDFSFSEDGRFLVAPRQSQEQVVTVWNTADGSEVVSLPDHQQFVSATAISRDNRWVATVARQSQTAGAPCEIKIWEIATGRLSRSIVVDAAVPPQLLRKLYERHEAAYREQLKDAPSSSKAAVCNNLAWFLVTCPDSNFWNAAEAVQLAQQSLALNPNFRGVWNTLAVAHFRAGDDRKALEAIQQSFQELGVTAIDLFFSAMAHQRLGNVDQARQDFEQAVQWMDAHRPDDDELMRFRAEASRMLGLSSQKNSANPAAPLRSPNVNDIAMSSDNQRIAVSETTYGFVQVWDISSGEPLHYLPEARHSKNLAFSPDGARLAAADWQTGKTLVWDMDTGRLRFAIPSPRAGSCVCFSPDGQRLAAVGYSGDVQLLDAETGQEILLLRGFGPPPGSRGQTPRVQFSADGHRLAAFTAANTISIWDATPRNALPLSVRLAAAQAREEWTVEPDMQHAMKAMRSLRKGLYVEAATEFRKAEEAGEELDHSQLATYALLQVIVENEYNFQTACEMLLEKYGDTQDPDESLSVLLACSAGEGMISDANRDRFINIVEHRLPNAWDQPAKRALLRAAIDVRCGRYQEALETLQAVDGPAADSFRAVAQLELGDEETATRLLNSVVNQSAHCSADRHAIEWLWSHLVPRSELIRYFRTHFRAHEPDEPRSSQ